MKVKKDKISQLIATMLLLIFIPSIVPAQEFSSQIKTGKMHMEYYLDRASREKSVEKWEEIAEQGMLAAMTAWENSNLQKLDEAEYEAKNEYQKIIDTNFVEWFTQKYLEDKTSKIQSKLHDALKTKAIEWKYIDQSGYESREVNIEEAELARQQWTKIANEVVIEFCNEWDLQCENLYSDMSERLSKLSLQEEEINNLLNNYISSYKEIVTEEYENIAAYEENLLLRNVLYDQESLKKKSDKEAATIIARQIAKETEKTTGDNLNKLFDEFEDQLNAGELDNISLSESDWYAEFERELNSSLEKWNEAEQSFLAARAEWEMNAMSVFEENETVWQEGFAELEKRKNTWNEKIYNQIKEIRNNLESRKTNLKEELSTSLKNYEVLLANQKASNEKTIEVHKTIYEQSRQLMKISSDGIDNWYQHWGEKYNGLYSYWKTEDANKCINYFNTTDTEPFKKEFEKVKLIITNDEITYDKSFITTPQEKINNWNIAYIELILNECTKNYSDFNDKTRYYRNQYILKGYINNPKTINNEKVKEIVEFCNEQLKHKETIFNGEYSSLFNTNDFIFGTGDILIEWRKSLAEYTAQAETEIVELYKKTGYALTGENSINELDVQLLKAEALKSYWAEELEVATALKNYITDKTSKVEIMAETEENLYSASNKYIEAQEKYQIALDELLLIEDGINESMENIVIANSNIELAQTALNEAQKNFEDVLYLTQTKEDEVLQKQIKQIIDSLNVNKTQENQETVVKEYYAALQKQANLQLKQEILSTIEYLKNGYVDENTKVKSLEELNKLQNISVNDVIEVGFNFNELKENIQNECSQELAQIMSVIDEYHSTSTENERINKILLTIEAAIIKIQNYYIKELQKRIISVDYLEGKEVNKINIDDDFKLETYLKVYFDYYTNQKVENAKEQIVELKDRFEAEKEDVISYIKENRNDSFVNDILKGNHFSEEQKLVLNALFEKKLCENDYYKNEIIDDVINNYKSYKIAELNTNNEQARKAVANIISNTSLDEITLDGLKKYIEDLRVAGKNLAETGAESLNLYINEVIYSYAINNESLQKNAAEKIILLESLYTENANIAREKQTWISSITSVETIEGVLNSKIFEDMLSSTGKNKELANNIIMYAATLYLPMIQDISSKDSIFCDDKLKEITSCKNLIVEEIWKLCNRYKKDSELVVSEEESENYETVLNIKNAYKVFEEKNKTIEENYLTWFVNGSEELQYKTQIDNTILSSLLTETEIIEFNNVIEKYITLGNQNYNFFETIITNFKDQEISTETIKNLIFSEYEKIIETLLQSENNPIYVYENLFNNNDIDEKLNKATINYKNNLLAEAEANFNAYVNTEENVKFWNTLKEDLGYINEEWFLNYAVSQKMLYMYLCKNLNNEEIEEVHNFLNNKNEEVFKDIESYKKILTEAESYNEILDNNLKDWINNKTEFSEEEKKLLEIVIKTGDTTLILPSYYNEIKQQALLDNYEGNSTSTELINSKSELYAQIKDSLLVSMEEDNIKGNNIYTEYLIYSYANTKQTENIETEVETIKQINKNIQESNNGSDVKEPLIEIDFNKIAKEITYEDIYKKYFIDSENEQYKYEDDSISVSSNEVNQSELFAIYSKIMQNRNERMNLFALLKESSNLLILMHENDEEKRQLREAAQSKLKEAENLYNNKKNEYNLALTKYSQKCAEYNSKLKSSVNKTYENLEEARLDYRKMDEIHRWAQNEYLHEIQGNDIKVKDYETAEERFERVKASYQVAFDSHGCIEKLYNDYNNNYDNFSSYKEEFTEYETAYEKYYKTIVLQFEVNAAIAQQEQVLKKAEEEVNQIKSKLLNHNNEDTNIILSDSIKKLVNVYYDKETGTYKAELKKKVEIVNEPLSNAIHLIVEKGVLSKCNHLHEDKTEKYFNEETKVLYIDENEEEVKVSLAEYEAFEWIKEKEKNPSELDEIVLASMYLMYMDNQITLDDIGQNEFVQSSKGKVPEKLHGVEFRDSFTRYIEKSMREAYKNVKAKQQESEIAKYLLYKDIYYIEGTEKLETRAINLLVERAYKEVSEDCQNKVEENALQSSIHAVLAAGFWALVSPFTAWFAVPAGIETALSIVFLGLSVDFNELRKQIDDFEDTATARRESYHTSYSNLMDDYLSKEAIRKKERETLDLMKYGKNTEGKLTYTSFIEGLSESLKNSKIYESKENSDGTNSIEIYLKEIYDISNTDSKGFEDLFNQVNPSDKETNSISVVITRMVSALGVTAKNKLANLEQKATELRENQKAYADKYNNLVQNQINGIKTAEETQTLNQLAEKAWGKTSWKESEYRQRMEKMYSKYINNDYASSERLLETYINDSINLMINEYSKKLSREAELLLEAKKAELNLIQENFDNEVSFIESQINQIEAVAKSEWEKGKDELKQKHQEWVSTFQEQLDEKRVNWENNYINFLAEKTEWINTQYVYATNAGNIELLKNSKTDIDAVLSKALALLDDSIAKESDKENIQKMVNESLETLVNGDMLNNLMSMVDSIGVSSKNTGKTVNNAVRKNQSSIDSFISALKVQDSITTEIKNKAAILAAQQAETTIAKMVKSFMDRIDAENASVRAWQENLVRNDGYTYGNTIEREVIVDASYANAKKEKQTIRKYKDFKTAAPDVKVEFGQDETESTIMRKIKEAQEKLTLWDKNIFGETEIVKTSEGKEYETTVYYDVSRETAATKNIELYKKEDKENSSKKEENNEDAGKNLVSIRDGVFGEYLGYGPKFKDKDVDFTKSAESNIEKQGSGQYGEILLDFQWNSMKFNYGLNQLSMPVYDKKLWLSDSFFEPPTIRSVASLVCDIAGSATGQSWWLGILDDALFASLDIVVEDKDVGEVATEFGKAALTNTISVGLGAASNGLSSLAGNISNTAAKVATQAAISASSAYISQVSNSYINSLSYSAENGWSMDWDNANNSWFSNDTLAATLGAGISTGISTGLNEFNLGVNNSKVHGFNSNQIDSIKNLNNLAGGLASSAVSFAFTGNATFNILNLTDFGTRINGGLLELTVGKDGISSKIGNGGTNISYSTIKSSISGASSLHKNSQINNTEYDKQTKDALRSQWGFGDKTAKKQLEEIIKGDTILKLDADGSEVAQSINENGQKIIHINSSQNEGFIDLGLTLQHEAHRDGIISDEQGQYIETVNAVAGHTKMALAMANDKLYTKDMLNHISSDTNLQNDINAYMYASYTGNAGLFADYVNAAYDSSADYWKLMDDGSLAYDGKANLYDENGNLIYKTDSQGIQGSLQEILGLENQTEAYNLMIQAGMKWDGTSWKNLSNPTDGSLAIKMDMTTGENGTGRTYKEIYETRELTDSTTGYTATLEQHNPVNIYNMMVSCGFGPVIYDYSAITMSNGEWNGRLPVRQLSYEEWKANNYIDNPSLAMIMLGKPLEDDSKVTSDFGMRKDPFGSDKKLFHTGTDFSALEGTPIYPMQDGYVFSLDFTEYGGNTVILQHNLSYDYKNFTISSNYYTNYLHLENNSNGKPNTNFNLGEFVTANQVLGYTGNTGPSTGPHLHAGIYFDSIQNNPYANWLYMDNYADNNRLSNKPFNNYYSNINYFREQGRW